MDLPTRQKRPDKQIYRPPSNRPRWSEDVEADKASSKKTLETRDPERQEKISEDRRSEDVRNKRGHPGYSSRRGLRGRPNTGQSRGHKPQYSEVGAEMPHSTRGARGGYRGRGTSRDDRRGGHVRPHNETSRNEEKSVVGAQQQVPGPEKPVVNKPISAAAATARQGGLIRLPKNVNFNQLSEHGGEASDALRGTKLNEIITVY